MSRITLRRFKDSDGDLLFELDNDVEVMRFINGGEPVSMQEVTRDLLPTFVGERDLGFWCIEAAGVPTGWVSLRRREPGDQAELGYRIKREYWGQGIASAAASLVLDDAREAGFKRVFGTTYEENLGSIRVMEKLGMQLVRQFKWNGDASDTAKTGGEMWDGFDVEFELLLGDIR